MTCWDDLAARARGLASRLLAPDRLRELARARDLDALSASLEALGYGPRAEPPATPAAVEEQVRRAAAARLRVLAWWAGARAPLLAPILEDEDRRSIRAMLRGAAAMATAAERLEGLVPTPSLPPRALGELARQATPREVAALLAAWAHPFGAAILEEARRQQPDPFTLECRLDRAFAERASEVAPKAGTAMREHVRLVVDTAATWSALTLALSSGETPQQVEEAWLPGGERVSRTLFRAAAASPPSDARAMLAGAWAGTPLGDALTAGGGTEALEDAALATQLAAARRIARVDPTSEANAVLFALRMRGEVRALRRITWGVALHAPASMLVEAA
jgi:vacuolar-type H+-ATPase subunit C/Vma6